MHWHRAVAHCAGAGTPYVIATVLATSGSAPREGGTKMVITRAAIYDSIGGGQLEHLVIERAREQLVGAGTGASVHHFPLAAAATQCCGGSVTVLLESFGEPALRATVFGAGHVGRRVIALLADLDAQVQWFDARPEIAAEAGVTCTRIESAAASVQGLESLGEVLVLTHDHQLDFDLVVALLERDVPAIGLIGSATKWQRFQARLRQRGFSDAQLQRVRCPVGAPQVPGKQPMAIAIAIVAELLQRRELPQVATEPLSWKQLRQTLVREP
ncbi:MAG: xanthine dehydrogenase accessory protein XdhC [Pseudomonadales bacterium]